MTVPVTQYLTDSEGKKVAAVISIEDYYRIVSILEDMEDVAIYDEVKSLNEESISLEDYIKDRKANALSN